MTKRGVLIGKDDTKLRNDTKITASSARIIIASVITLVPGQPNPISRHLQTSEILQDVYHFVKPRYITSLRLRRSHLSKAIPAVLHNHIIIRTRMLRGVMPLKEVPQKLCPNWQAFFKLTDHATEYIHISYK